MAMWWGKLKVFFLHKLNQVSISKYTFLSQHYENNLKTIQDILTLYDDYQRDHLLILFLSMKVLVWSPFNIPGKGRVQVVKTHENPAKYYFQACASGLLG